MNTAGGRVAAGGLLRFAGMWAIPLLRLHAARMFGPAIVRRLLVSPLFSPHCILPVCIDVWRLPAAHSASMFELVLGARPG